MRVLALVPGGIGDQLLMFPTLDSLKQRYPQGTIDVVVEPRSQGAYKITQSVHKTWNFDFKGANSLADWGNLIGTIREQEYEAVISLGQRWSVGFLLWLTGIPNRISYAGQGDLFLTQAIPLNRNQYAAKMYHDLLNGLDIDLECPSIKVNIPKKDLDWAESTQASLNIKDSGYILIHGGSSALAKQKGIDKIYPAASWAKIIEALQLKLPNLPVVLIQGPEDGDFIKALQAHCDRTLLVTTPDDIGKLAGMIGAANLMLCTDSAPMHIGVGVGTNLVALFGPTEPEKLLPDEKRFMWVKSRTGQPISAIAPEEVIAKLFP
jgi:ADP-heptose:LPS heptosyltransferase